MAQFKALAMMPVLLLCAVLGATEVTRGQWKAIMGTCPDPDVADDNLPVDQVGWDDCRVFLRKLSEREGRTYRLPTEAEQVFRGGAWYDEAYRCRSAFRYSRHPASRCYFGLRVVLAPEP